MRKPASYTDDELIEGVRRGENWALDVLYKRHFGLVQKFIVNNSGSRDEAQDIYQEAMIVLCEKLADHTFQLQCAVSTFLYSVSRRLWLKHLRDEGRKGLVREEHDMISEDAGLLADGFLETEARLKQMEEGMKLLGEPCATILKDYYAANMSMEAIAEKFGYTNADNAKNQKYKCLQRLKKMITGY